MTRRPALLCAAVASLAALAASAADEHARPREQLPTGEAARWVSLSSAAPVASLTIVTEALAVRETGPKETVARFGETYAFLPGVLLVHRDEPTRLTFRNLQPDDEHDFRLVGPDGETLVHLSLPPLEDVAHTFVFHREGLFRFDCTLHPPAMGGQLLVLPPRAG